VLIASCARTVLGSHRAKNCRRHSKKLNENHAPILGEFDQDSGGGGNSFGRGEETGREKYRFLIGRTDFWTIERRPTAAYEESRGGPSEYTAKKP